MLFEVQPGGDVSPIQAVLWLDVPVAGGYTLGQIVPGGKETPQFLNQYVAVVVFGEPEEKEN
jgi:hypothetical protein